MGIFDDLFKDEDRKSVITSTPRKKSKYVTKQCKYCGYRVTYLATGITPGTTCPRRGKGQPHVWQTLGYEYK